MVMNIVSNWQLNAVIENDDFENHPFIELIHLGIPLTLDTDDKGRMFNNECVVVVEHSNIQYSELKAISYTAVTTLFADEDKKDALLMELDSEFEAFEAQYGAISMSMAPALGFLNILLLTVILFEFHFFPSKMCTATSWQSKTRKLRSSVKTACHSRNM